jgi:hypothetical protein
MKRQLFKVFDKIKATADFSQPKKEKTTMSTNANKLFDQAKAPAERYVLGESIVASAESGTMTI